MSEKKVQGGEESESYKTADQARSELNALLASADRNWFDTAKKLLLIQDNEFWLQYAPIDDLGSGHYPTFSSWLKAYAAERKVAPNYLFRLKSSAQAYEHFVLHERHRFEEEQKIPGPEECLPDPDKKVPLPRRLSADAIALICTIAQDDKDKQVDLAHKVIAGKLKRADLRKLAAIARNVRLAAGKTAARKNHNSHYVSIDSKDFEAPIQAADVKLAFALDHDWLPDRPDPKYGWYKTFNDVPLFRSDEQAIAELLVLAIHSTVGGTYRLDGVLFEDDGENLKSLSAKELQRHAFEQCDRLWYVVPEAFVSKGQNVLPTQIGIITVHRTSKLDQAYELHVIRPAEQGDERQSERLLSILLGRLITRRLEQKDLFM